jgi:hypothetical protein
MEDRDDKAGGGKEDEEILQPGFMRHGDASFV